MQEVTKILDTLICQVPVVVRPGKLFSYIPFWLEALEETREYVYVAKTWCLFPLQSALILCLYLYSSTAKTLFANRSLALKNTTAI